MTMTLINTWADWLIGLSLGAATGLLLRHKPRIRIRVRREK